MVSYLARDYCGIERRGTMPWQTQTEVILPIEGAYSHIEVSITPRKIISQTQVTGRLSTTSLDGITSGIITRGLSRCLVYNINI